MSAKTNKSQMLRFIEFINTADINLGKELISEDAVFYAPTNSEPLRGIEGYMFILNMMRNSFPDIKWELDEMIADENNIAARFTMTGTHKGNFLDIAPTGKVIKINAMNFYRFYNGKIVEEYGQPDIFGLIQQIKSQNQ